MEKEIIKRLNYFDGQFLTETDFNEEQRYHRHMRRQISYILFEQGGVIGPDDLKLEIVSHVNKTFKVKEGMAIGLNHNQKEGKEIILDSDSGTINLEKENIVSGQNAIITISYFEEQGQQSSTGGVSGDTRMIEKLEIGVYTDDNPPPPVTSKKDQIIKLGTITYDNNTMQIDESNRQEAKLRASLIAAAPATLVSINITSDSNSFSVEVGSTLQLTATGYYSDGNQIDITDTVTWGSEKKDVATVNSNGLVTGKDKGEAGIVARLNVDGDIIRSIIVVEVTVPPPEFNTNVLIAEGKEFESSSGHGGEELLIYGINFFVDDPDYPSVELVDKDDNSSVLQTFTVSSIDDKTSDGINYEEMSVRIPVVTLENIEGKIRVTTTGGSIISNKTFLIVATP